MKSLFMESTEISAERSVQEIQRCLGRYGVSKVMTEYEKGEVSAVSFMVKVGSGEEIPFRLPARWRAILELLIERRGTGVNSDALLASYIAKARRVAWRQVLRWIEAQMALVETKMVKVEEVFLPYRQVGPAGETVFEMIQARGVGLLDGPR